MPFLALALLLGCCLAAGVLAGWVLRTWLQRGTSFADAAFFDNSPQAMWIYDPQTLRFLDVNATAVSLYGYSRDEFMTMGVDDVELDVARLRALLADDSAHRVSRGWKHLRGDGTTIDVEISSRPIVFGDTNARLVSAVDVTERMRNEERLQHSEAALATAQQVAHLGSFWHNLQTGERQWSPELFRIYGMSPDAALPAAGVWEFDHPEDAPWIREKIETARRDGVAYSLDHRILRPDGSVRHVHEQGRWTPDARGVELLNIGTIVDITDRKEAEAALAHLAYHDSLTGLPNRTRLIEELDNLLTEGNDDVNVALLFIDVDRFKTINDTLGHQYGDDVLIEVGTRLRAGLRDTDIVARPGGDEFIVVLRDVADKLEVSRAADNILAAFERPFLVGGHAHHVSASIGVSMCPSDGRDVETLLQSADSAMYAAKARGGNNFHFYTANLQLAAARRFKLESSLRRAIERSEFKLHYQPVLNVRSGAIVAAEALIRWNDPEMGVVMPDEFISFAEETGLIVPIGDWVFREACVQAKLWSASGHRVKIWVNVSAAQLHHSQFVTSIGERLSRTGLDPACIGLELTESSFIDGRTEIIAALRELKGIGLNLALDDFGVAYSSLDYVRRLPIDTIKIDRTFLRDIATDRFNQSIVRAIVGIAHDLQLHVTAEGVETTAQFDFLSDLGCDDWQGFYYGEAVEPAAFMRLLQTFRGHGPAGSNYFGQSAV